MSDKKIVNIKTLLNKDTGYYQLNLKENLEFCLTNDMNETIWGRIPQNFNYNSKTEILKLIKNDIIDSEWETGYNYSISKTYIRKNLKISIL